MINLLYLLAIMLPVVSAYLLAVSFLKKIALHIPFSTRKADGSISREFFIFNFIILSCSTFLIVFYTLFIIVGRVVQ